MGVGESNVRPIMNLANSIVGVSILAMPYCFSQCGILLGIILLLSCTLFTAWSCKMLMRAAIMTHNHTYEHLALGVYGSLGKYITAISIIGLNLGTCIAFFVIIGDLAPPIVAQFFGLTWMSPYTLRACVLIASAVFIAFPLGLLRSINSLSGISLCSLLFYAMLTVELFSVSLPNLRSSWWSHVTWWDNAGFFKCVPIFALAFACQTQLFVIYSALADPSFRRISSVINGATIAIATLYSLIAFFGVVSFTGDGVKGDVLANFDISFISQLFRLGFSVSVVVSFPLMIFPCRVSINALLFSSKSLELHVQEPIPQRRFVLITGFIIGLTLIVAILVPNVETVLGLTGATMGCLIAFIFPSLMFLKVVGSGADFSNRAKVLALVGLGVMVLSTTSILQAEMNRTATTVEGEDGKLRPWPKPPADILPPSLPPRFDKPLPPVAPQPVKPVIPDNPPGEEVANNPLPPVAPQPVKPVIPDHPPAGEEVANEANVPVQVNKPVEPVLKGDVQGQSPHDQAAHQGEGNRTAGGGGAGGVAGRGVAVSAAGGVKDMQELQKGMHQLQSRLDHLEEENKDLKERQKLLEHIQVDDLLQHGDKVLPDHPPAAVEGGGVAGGGAEGQKKEVVGGGNKERSNVTPLSRVAAPEGPEGAEQRAKRKESEDVGVPANLPPEELAVEKKSPEVAGEEEGGQHGRALKEVEADQGARLNSDVADHSNIGNQTLKTRRDLKNVKLSPS